jgi:putative transposase
MIEQLDISERRACCYAGLSRTSYREPPSMDVASQELSARIVELAHLRRRFGYRRIHDLLGARGPRREPQACVAAVQAQRAVGAQAPQARRVNLERTPLIASRHVNDTWSADFVMDALANSRRIKCLTVVDDFRVAKLSNAHVVRDLQMGDVRADLGRKRARGAMQRIWT